MTEEEIQIAKQNAENAKIIRRVANSKDGKQFIRILRDHFQVDVPSAPLANWDTNQTFYRDGNKAPFTLIDQVLGGLWDSVPADDDEDENPSPLPP